MIRLTEVLEQVENWFALLIERDEFAIDHRIIRQAGEILCNVQESLGQVGAALRVERDLAAGLHGLQAIAIELQFVSQVSPSEIFSTGKHSIGSMKWVIRFLSNSLLLMKSGPPGGTRCDAAGDGTGMEMAH